MSLEDIIPESYKYCWTPSNKMSLDEFLAEYKPKNIRNDAVNSKPFIWVRKSDKAERDIYLEAILEAKAILDDITKEILDVKENKDIPLRANKAKGIKSKKEVREEIQARATEKLGEIAKKHGFVRGKWLAFADSLQVNALFERLAHSLISGDLSKTTALEIRVSTHPTEDPENGAPNRHTLAVEIPDVYDAEQAKVVMKVLLRDQGLKLSGAKADLYSAIGLTSKHASGIQSTVWKGTGGAGSLMTEKEVQDLRSGEARGSSTAKPAKGAATKSKTVGDAENPFASDDEEEEKGAKSKVTGVETKPKSKEGAGQKNKKEPAQKRAASTFDSDNEEDEPPKKVAKTAAGTAGRKAGPKPKIAVKKKKTASSDEE